MLTDAFGIAYNAIFEFFYNITPVGSLALSIISFTIITKLLLLPLSIKQQKSMLTTQAMQPELLALQEKYKDKKDAESQQKMAEEMQQLYTKYKTNPFAGCLLPFLQIPIILALFNVLKGAHIYLEKLGTIYNSLTTAIMKVPNFETILSNLGSMKRLAQTDYSIVDNVKNLFTTLNEADWTALIIDVANSVDVNQMETLIASKTQIESIFGLNLINQPTWSNLSIILPILTVLITYISIRMSTKAQDTSKMDEKTKAMMNNMTSMNNFLLVLIFVSSMSLPSGLSLYWMLGNLWQIIQQKLIKKYVK